MACTLFPSKLKSQQTKPAFPVAALLSNSHLLQLVVPQSLGIAQEGVFVVSCIKVQDQGSALSLYELA